MILLDNLQRLYDEARSRDRVLDVGGWFRPFNLSTHVVDIQPYDTRQGFHALDPEHEERFTVETWFQINACEDEWPFPDNFFDFSICSHTLEDLPDPISVCEQLNRVSKAGYIEVPSKLREIFTKQRFAGLRLLLGQQLDIGFPHHHWICEIENNNITFLPKNTAELQKAGVFLTRKDLKRKLTQQEAGICLWWQGSFDYEKVSLPEGHDLTHLHSEALKLFEPSPS